MSERVRLVCLRIEKQTPRWIWRLQVMWRCRRTLPPFTPRTFLSATSGWPLAMGLVTGIGPNDLGWPAKVSPMYARAFTVTTAASSRCTPTGNRTRSACTSVATLDIEDFGADIDVYLGKGQERHTLNSCSVIHYVPESPTGRRKKTSHQAVHPDDVGHRTAHGELLRRGPATTRFSSPTSRRARS